MIFETSRLVVRKLSEHDLEAFHDMQRNPRVMQYTSGQAMSLEENRADLQKVIGAYSKPGNSFWVWAMEQKAGGELIGTCALITNEESELEIGFRIREKFWSQGYGREVTGALIRYVFEVEKKEELVAYVYTDNQASVRILERYMQLEKEFFNEAAQCMDRKYVLSAGRYRQMKGDQYGDPHPA